MRSYALRNSAWIILVVVVIGGCGKSGDEAVSESQALSSPSAKVTPASSSSGTQDTTDKSDLQESHLPTQDSSSSTAAGGPAIVDLNRVAIGLDRIEGFETRIKARKEELESQIKLLDDAYEQEVNDLKNAAGEQPTAELEDQIAAKERERLININEARRQAAQQLRQFEDQVKREFMDEIRPIAFDVANEAGFTVVFTVPQVYAFKVDSPSDITKRVIDRVRVAQPSQPSSDLPRLAAPSSTSETR